MSTEPDCVEMFRYCSIIGGSLKGVVVMKKVDVLKSTLIRMKNDTIAKTSIQKPTNRMKAVGRKATTALTCVMLAKVSVNN